MEREEHSTSRDVAARAVDGDQRPVEGLRDLFTMEWVAGVPFHKPTTQTSPELVARALVAASTNHPVAVTFVNPSAARATTKHRDYIHDLLCHDLVLPDGIGIVLAARSVGIAGVQRYSMDSTSLAIPLLRALPSGATVALIGGAQGVASRAAVQLGTILEDIRFISMDGDVSPEDAVALVDDAQPKLTLIGMGIGKQERHALDVKLALANGIVSTCGGYFDQLASGIQYYPAFINKWNLRWLYRLFKEPRRLWRRYFLDYPYFIAAVARKRKRPFSSNEASP